MFNSGWANNCGVELFTLGWVRCEISKGGGAEEVLKKLPKKQKETLQEDILGQTLDDVP